MISKHIECEPKNDNYGRLARYIADARKGLEHDRDDRKRIEIYEPHPVRDGGRSYSENRLRRLSECRLAHGQRREEGKPAHLLSLDARPDRHADGGMRREDAAARAGRSSGEKCLMSWCAGCLAGDDYDLAVQEVRDTQRLNIRSNREKTYHLVVSFRPEDMARLKPEDFKAIEQRFAEVLGLAEHQRHCGVHVNTNNPHMHVAYNLIHPIKLTRAEASWDYVKRERLCRELEKQYGLTRDRGREDTLRGEALTPKAATFEARTGELSFEGYAREQGADILKALEEATSWKDVHETFALRGMEIRKRGAGLVAMNRYGKQTAKLSSIDRSLGLRKLEDRFGAFHPVEDRKALPKYQVRYRTQAQQKHIEARENFWKEFQEQKEKLKIVEAQCREKWRAQRKELEGRKTLTRQARGMLKRLAHRYEQEELEAIRERLHGNWLEFLRDRAAQGDETALAVLRSRKEPVAPEQPPQKRNNPLLPEEVERLTPKTRNQLQSEILMESLVPGAKMTVTNHGTLIFSLPGGGVFCDTGKKIVFDAGSERLAADYARKKWHLRKEEVALMTKNQEITRPDAGVLCKFREMDRGR